MLPWLLTKPAHVVVADRQPAHGGGVPWRGQLLLRQSSAKIGGVWVTPPWLLGPVSSNCCLFLRLLRSATPVRRDYNYAGAWL